MALVARDAGPLGGGGRRRSAHAAARRTRSQRTSADKTAIHRIAGAAQALVGEIAIAVHNASTLGALPLRLLLDTECEDLAAVLETNLVGPFRPLTKLLAGRDGAARQRRARTCPARTRRSSRTRAGARTRRRRPRKDQLSRVLAAELAGTGVRVAQQWIRARWTPRCSRDAPEADRAQLQRPDAVAARIVALIANAERAPSGAEAGGVMSAAPTLNMHAESRPVLGARHRRGPRKGNPDRRAPTACGRFGEIARDAARG